MAHSLELRVTAEGVESEEQESFLRDRRCDEVQGFHVSHPLTSAKLAELVRSGRLTRNSSESSEDRSRTLLIIGGSQSIVRYVETVAKVSGLRFFAAATCEEAWHLMDESMVDVVIADHLVGAEDGLEFLQQARILSPRTTRIVLGSGPAMKRIMAAMNEGTVFTHLDDELPEEEFVKELERALLFSDRSRKPVAQSETVAALDEDQAQLEDQREVQTALDG
jgi:response regulator RpfG family c-di-GMP phosphodiesterase